MASKEDSILLTHAFSDSLKGLSILIIVFHHIVDMYINTNIVIKYVLGITAPIAVAFFLLMSGYGVFLSLKKNNESASHKILKLCLRLYITFFICYTIYLLFIKFLNIAVLNNHNILKTVWCYLSMTLQPHSMWYLKIQLLAYLSLFLALKYVPKHINLFLWILWLFEVGISIIKGTQGCWYASSLAFPFGVFIASNYNKVSNFVEKNKINIIITSITFFILLLLIHWKYKIILLSLLGCFIILSISNIIRAGNKVLINIGKLSLDLYILHLVIMNLIKYSFINTLFPPNIGVIIILMLTYSFAIILNRTVKCIIRRN